MDAETETFLERCRKESEAFRQAVDEHCILRYGHSLEYLVCGVPGVDYLPPRPSALRDLALAAKVREQLGLLGLPSEDAPAGVV